MLLEIQRAFVVELRMGLDGQERSCFILLKSHLETEVMNQVKNSRDDSVKERRK